MNRCLSGPHIATVRGHCLLLQSADLVFLLQAHENGDDGLPWGTLRYLIGEAMYGGRVSDSYDRRILTTYLDEYLGDFLFDAFQPFYFFKNDSVEYK